MSDAYVYTDSNGERGQRKGKFFLYSRAGYLDRLAIQISRMWSKHPRWFSHLDKDIQIDLIADYILDQEGKKEREERKKKYNIEQVRKMRERNNV